jgi:hypothetical protein
MFNFVTAKPIATEVISGAKDFQQEALIKYKRNNVSTNIM